MHHASTARCSSVAERRESDDSLPRIAEQHGGGYGH